MLFRASDSFRKLFNNIKMLQSQDIPAEVAAAKQRFSIIGNSPALIRAIARAIRVAPIDLSVLVTGESG